MSLSKKIAFFNIVNWISFCVYSNVSLAKEGYVEPALEGARKSSLIVATPLVFLCNNNETRKNFMLIMFDIILIPRNANEELAENRRQRLKLFFGLVNN